MKYLATIVAAFAFVVPAASTESARAAELVPVRIGDGSLVAAIVKARSRTHACRDTLGRRRFPVSYAAERSSSLPFRAWTLRRWRSRAEACEAARERERASLGRLNDYATAVRHVERYFGRQPFLWSCPKSEGGFGAWKWNGGVTLAESATRPRGSSGAGGWLQFLRSTFDSVIDDAIRHARERGMPVPASAASWYSPLGQALAGVEMLRDGRAGEWSGSTC